MKNTTSNNFHKLSFYGEVTQDEYVQIYWWPKCASIEIYQHLTYSQLTRTKWLVGKMVSLLGRWKYISSFITGTLNVYFICHYWDVESTFYLSLLGRWKYKSSFIIGTLKVYFIFHYWDVESIFYLSLLGHWKNILPFITGTLKAYFIFNYWDIEIIF